MNNSSRFRSSTIHTKLSERKTRITMNSLVISLCMFTLLMVQLKFTQAVWGPNPACLLPPDNGTCFALFQRWYFDIRTRQCRRFYYHGCLGNDNRFLEYIDCARACKFYRWI
ncbi:hypothetical protein CHS0354_037679 [Potamilus streckersoni]|uniref:BPTI/Kunitz inhibitor domain-containing protein n=1 Tax=Potamilus streckersoni TaxID=2493646 RepID=A0AAE0W518_9BIVA|nr:hypothetical protein CHS0354_037679 [Potamilus streckersoni]